VRAREYFNWHMLWGDKYNAWSPAYILRMGTHDTLGDEKPYFRFLCLCLCGSDTMMKEVGQWVFRKLTPEANIIYAEPIILEELKWAVDKGLGNKAPRADGIVHEFYIHFWGVIKTGLLSIYNSIVRNGYLLPQQILSTIVRVPKCEAPRTVNDYRSLILLNTD